MANRKHTKYREGQWFAVPLLHSGFVMGTIAWGSDKTKYALGYFIGPKLDQLPTERYVEELQAPQAILIRWFGNAPLTYGEWPLLKSTVTFDRSAWPIPQFGRIDSLDPTLGWLTTYSQSDSSVSDRNGISTPCSVDKIIGLPFDVLSGSESLRIVLDLLLEHGRHDLAVVTKRSPA